MVSITRLSGGITPGNGSDPRTFPAIWNATADELEALGISDLSGVTITSPTTGQVLEWNGTAWVNGQVDANGIASNAVTTAKILDANVTRPKLSSGLVNFTAVERIVSTNASWAIPALGSPIVKVTVIGAGGGGGDAYGAGSTGGTTTFNAGTAGTITSAAGAGGSAEGQVRDGPPANGGFASGNHGIAASRANFGWGAGSNGGGGEIRVAYLNMTGISTANVTIGAGGAGGGQGGVGGRGEVIFEYVAA